MNRPTGVSVLAAALLLVLAAACSSSDSGKGQVVQQFYDHLNSERYSAAVALYSTEVLEMLGPDGAAGEGFTEWAKEETLEGKVDEVKIVKAEEAEGGMTVVFELIYADGSTAKRSVSLIEEGGGWKLGFIQNG